MSTKIVLFANHTAGYKVAKFLYEQADVDILHTIVYPDKKGMWWKSVGSLAHQYRKSIKIYESNKQIIDQLKGMQFDLLISCGWRHRIPSNILKLPLIGAVNIHNSLLPEYRGVFACSWAILQGNNKSGVTLHWMDKDFDTGAIIHQLEFEIYPEDTLYEVWQRSNTYALRVLKEAWPRVAQWKKLSKPQIGKFSYFSAQDFQRTNEISLSRKQTARDFINLLRAKTFKNYYNNAFFIDPHTKKKIYISIKLHTSK